MYNPRLLLYSTTKLNAECFNKSNNEYIKLGMAFSNQVTSNRLLGRNDDDREQNQLWISRIK